MAVLCHPASEMGGWTPPPSLNSMEKNEWGEQELAELESTNAAPAQASDQSVWLPQPRKAPKLSTRACHEGQPLECAWATVAIQCWAGPRL